MSFRTSHCDFPMTTSHFYRPQRSCGKVIFYTCPSVIPFTGGCLEDTPWADTPVADLKGGARDAHPPGVQILSISYSFWENLAKLYVGAPPGELAPPPRGNPGSATAHPPGRYSPWAHPPGRHPPTADGYCSGRYASYWNACLLRISKFIHLDLLCSVHNINNFFVKTLIIKLYIFQKVLASLS